MKNRISISCALVVSALVASAANVEAQQIRSPYRFLDHGQFVGAWGGYVWAAEGRLANGPQPAPIVGAAWAIRVSGPFALGADIGFMPTTRTVRDTTFSAADSMFTAVGEADVRLLTVMGNLRVNLTGARTWNGLQPFGLVGAGVALDLASGAAVEADLASNERYDFGTSFAGQLGAGVDWFPSPRVSVRVDVRDMFWKLPVPEAFLFTQNGSGFPRSEWEQNVAVAAGLSIHF